MQRNAPQLRLKYSLQRVIEIRAHLPPCVEESHVRESDGDPGEGQARAKDTKATSRCPTVPHGAHRSISSTQEELLTATRVSHRKTTACQFFAASLILSVSLSLSLQHASRLMISLNPDR